MGRHRDDISLHHLLLRHLERWLQALRQRNPTASDESDSIQLGPERELGVQLHRRLDHAHLPRLLIVRSLLPVWVLNRVHGAGVLGVHARVEGQVFADDPSRIRSVFACENHRCCATEADAVHRGEEGEEEERGTDETS